MMTPRVKRLLALLAATGCLSLNVVEAPSASAFTCTGVVRETQVYDTWSVVGGAVATFNTATYAFLQGDYNNNDAAFSINTLNVSSTSYQYSGATVFVYLGVQNTSTAHPSVTQGGFFNFTYCAK